ncbi:2'-deoxycytidine 5'-triphosphate deaminase [Bartonella schoenbuchensis]|uniref:2'-deoxycytidine 5'-triphosphate deaminase n=3 Tax=Bartonella TaxID=773 RepID=E6YXY0_BARSR|nr:2'-deoxycytidine 5'-triphosphate deaminase [Bartonella schoenbuchensis]AQX30155.1 dCTP deaminase [Bartonella schoenbuchensis R1]ENN92668.1 2'-deoxycytidine 5'-triphosphate deaminase [Bartonella schoenbuchensis m07a]CBI81718.1 2'-deoxycytidine 5'-triphosphate deaminase [Bartonella schoenbuchensis R1]
MVCTNGILADSDIQALIDSSVLKAICPFDADQIQPASIDLRLGKKAYRIRASFMPGLGTKVFDKLERLKLHEFDLQEGAVLETGCVYIVPLLENLDLPNIFSAVANPKSSTGRLDVFTRVITDNAQEFDKICAGYHGPLYLEISPRTFPILVRTGSRLSQLRFRKGQSYLNGIELHALHRNEMLISDDFPNISDDGIGLSVNLKGNEEGLVGYRGKHHTSVIDVDQRCVANVLDFWEPIYDCGEMELVLDPDEFYILVSQESIHVPPLYAAEMTPFNPLVGEFRVHYAGFFDPGFGHTQAGGKGARAVLEVRSHEVPFILEHGQMIGRLVYEHMLNRPSLLYGHDIGSHYQAQGLKLSKHFK